MANDILKILKESRPFLISIETKGNIIEEGDDELEDW